MITSSLILLAGATWGLILAAVALVKSPRTLARWAFAAGMSAFALESLFVALSLTASTLDQLIRWQALRYVTVAFLPLPWLLFALCYGRGNHSFYVRNARPFLLLAGVLPVVPLVGFAHIISVQVSGDILQPYGTLVLGWPAKALSGLLVASAVLILMNFERTYRAAVGVMLWRIKFVALGLGLLFSVRIYTSSQAILYSSFNPALESFNAAALLLACGLMTVAVLRSGMFSADIYPSQTVIFRSLTVFVAGLYLVLVGVMANFVTWLGGDPAFPLEAFVILLSLVALACVFASARLRLIARRFVSRHFDRPLYDYRQVWRTFAERTASMADEVSLCRQSVKLVSETLDVLSVTIWLTDEQQSRFGFGASTSVKHEHAGELLPSGLNAAKLIDTIRNRPEPMNLNTAKEDWATEFRRANPDQFPKQEGNRLCLPLVAKTQVVGLLNVGDRVSGIPFSIEDLELLKCIADQIAGSLLALRLSRRLLEAKEMDAFQTMAAFFVHDLKNTASSLSLMMQNLPAQFDNPDFRQDALRAVSKGVGRLNDLIARLGSLRQSAQIQPVSSDLCAVVAASLDGISMPPGVTLTRHLVPMPMVPIDPSQMQKVVTNLVINAQEAMRGPGEIVVSTARQDSSIVLSVRDNGSGMSPEFVRRSLFRPFQTTKKTGLGIGMFHCRMIVEAHAGRIEVETEEGKGTNFRVVLPLNKEIA